MASVHIGSHEATIENPRFLVTNKRGDFFALGNPNVSNYDGFFVKTPASYVKLLHSLELNGMLRSLDLRAETVFRTTNTSTQTFELKEEGLLAELKGQQILTLDCKKLYDESAAGRIYDVTLHAADKDAAQGSLASISVINVHYKKYTGDDCAQQVYEIHLCIATTLRVELLKNWRKVDYSYDSRRGTHNTPWVFDLATFSGTGKVTVCYAQSEQEAQRIAIDMLIMGKRKERKDQEIPTLPKDAQLAWRALAALQTRTGVMAGLPWFFQEWSRDELVSCGGLLAAKQYDAVLRILEKWYAALRPDGQLPAIYPDQGLVSSDAPGWLGKRTKDLLVLLSQENLMHKVPAVTIVRWRDLTGRMLEAARVRDGLVLSDVNTTWMDTQYNDDGRAGARIEIQALYLALYECHAYLCTITKTPVAVERKQAATTVQQMTMSKLVQQNMLLDGLHADGSPDMIVRPNIFLAWYIAPELFSNQQWGAFFRAVLPKLWLSWGGLASIATDDANFHAHSTGENTASYHRGDSWYYINNIAVMALNAVDPEGFKVQVSKIIGASCSDLFSQGYIGHCSEISSAAQQEAFGCHAQAWSASTLLEVLMRTQRG